MASAGHERPGVVQEGEWFAVPAAALWGWSLLLVLVLAVAGLCLVLPWLAPPQPDNWQVPLLGAGLFLPCAALLARLLWRKLHRYRMDEQAITRLRPWSGPVLLPWDRITRLGEDSVLGDLDLHGEGPHGPVVFHLDPELRGSRRLWMAVLERVGWLALPAEAGGAVAWPAVVHRKGSGLKEVVGVVVVAAALAAVLRARDVQPWWSVLAPLCVALVRVLRDWHAIEIDRESLVIATPLRRWSYTADQIQAIRFGLLPPMRWTVLVHLESGKPWKLRENLAGSLRLYRLLEEAYPGKV